MIVKIDINQLDRYNAYVRHIAQANPYEKIPTLNEFVSDEVGKDVVADLSNINFKKNSIEFAYGAKLDGSILTGINFSAKNFVIKGVSFKGAKMDKCTFTDGISLEGSVFKFGQIENSSEVFLNCDLSETKFEISKDESLLYKPNENQINKFTKLKSDISFNEFLQNELGRRVIADFSGEIIRNKFNNCNLQGSILRDAIVDNGVTGINFKDCIFKNTIFRNPDKEIKNLLQTELANKEVRATGTKSSEIVECSIEDVKNYLATLKKPGLQRKSFAEFKGINSKQRALFYNTKFNDVDFSKGDFSNCDFSECLFRGSNFSNSTFDNSSFMLCTMSSIANEKQTEMKNASFKKCQFLHSHMNSVIAIGAEFEDTKFYHCKLQEANFEKASLENSSIIDCRMDKFSAPSAILNKSKIIRTSMKSANFENAQLVESFSKEVNVEGASFKSSDFTRSFFYSTVAPATFENANLSNSRIAGDMSNCDFKSANIEGTDIAGIDFIGNKKPNFEAYSGIPINDPKTIDFRGEEINEKKRESQRKFTVRKVLFYVAAATLTAIIVPLSIASVALSAAAMQPLITAGMYALGVIAFDAITLSYLDKSTKGSKVTANVLGATRTIEVEQDLKSDINQVKESVKKAHKELGTFEKFVKIKNRNRDSSNIKNMQKVAAIFQEHEKKLNKINSYNTGKESHINGLGRVEKRSQEIISR